MTWDPRQDDRRKAREYGARFTFHMRAFNRAVEIAARQGAPCLSGRDLDWLAGQAWANARLAMHHARRAAGER